MANEIKEDDTSYLIDCLKSHKINFDYCLNELLDYITNLQEEIKEWEYIQNIQNNRKYRKRYLEERRKEETNLYLPDYDEVYQRYYEQKERIDKTLDMIDLIIPELWNINNNMTYKLQDVRRTLRGDE